MIKITLSTKLGELRWSQADIARATGIRLNTISELSMCEYMFTNEISLILFANNSGVRSASVDMLLSLLSAEGKVDRMLSLVNDLLILSTAIHYINRS